MVEGSDDIRELLSDDYSTGRISARVEMNESQRLAHHVPEIERRMKDIFRGVATVEPTGLVYLMNRMEQYLLSSQIKSFFLAFALTAVIIMILLRSVKLGLMAMIPNFLPILFSLALMPRLGISLDVGTVMIAAIALGLVVDDTIHFMSRLKLEAARANDTRSGIARAMKGAGRPIIYTSIALCLGFSVLTLSSFNPIIHFGILSVIVISLALVFDLIFLPAVMGFFELSPEDLK